MKLVDYDFDLPNELIAQHPTAERDLSRLLVLNRRNGSVQHLHFHDIVDLLNARDALVLNQTRVMPARLIGVKADTGGRVELLLIRLLPTGEWLAMGRPGRSLRPGTRLEFGQGQLQARIADRTEAGRFLVQFDVEDVLGHLDEVGEIPLPPYIRRRPNQEDRDRYQTVYAQSRGAIAAPTAGLHFTPELLDALEAKGVAVLKVLLHVGPGTFEPVRCVDPRQHRLEAEFCELDEPVATELAEHRRAGGRIVAVGTTVVRTLESGVDAQGTLQAFSGFSDKFIYPPYEFGAIDALVTNFHLPRSSLLFLVAAFAGRERLFAAYREAVEQGYRFYSYGDAMMIL
jgi:S-adenosylmethionine:tRNA ribosyltransferase-isomerase